MLRASGILHEQPRCPYGLYGRWLAGQLVESNNPECDAGYADERRVKQLWCEHFLQDCEDGSKGSRRDTAKPFDEAFTVNRA